jgi:hypothetical protein
MPKTCCSATPVCVEICYPGVDCENQKILDMYGAEFRYRALAADCVWVDLGVGCLYPNKHFEFLVDADGEYEIQWRPIRHVVKTSGDTTVKSTKQGPWSKSTIISVATAPPIQGEPAKVILSSTCVH